MHCYHLASAFDSISYKRIRLADPATLGARSFEKQVEAQLKLSCLESLSKFHLNGSPERVTVCFLMIQWRGADRVLYRLARVGHVHDRKSQSRPLQPWLTWK